MYEHDTIAAIATPRGEGGVAIIKISGPNAESIVRKVFLFKHPPAAHPPRSHHLYFGHVIDPDSNQILDQGFLTIMRAPRSHTGEDVAEIHCHGGSFLAQRILTVVLRQGARVAQAGEFTKRAFLNSRLDLSQADAVLDLIQAKSDQGVRLAWEQLAGHLSETCATLRERLLQLTAYVEAYIDFPDEDIPERAQHELAHDLTALINDIATLARTFTQGKVYREGVRTAIIGKPNVGKSSLLNLLVGAERAIVTTVPGTTRDIIEETVLVGGIPLVLWDTAGLRHTTDEVERIGVERARAGIAQAELILAMFDSSRPLDNEDEIVLDAISTRKAILILNKSDLPQLLPATALRQRLSGNPLVRLSAKTGEGRSALEACVQETVFSGNPLNSADDQTIISHVRHHDALIKAEQRLQEALNGLATGVPIDLIAVDLHAALHHIGEITGHVTSEDILDQIFREFCIGK